MTLDSLFLISRLKIDMLNAQCKNIVWINDVPWADSGMAIQSRHVIEHLVALGHKIHYFAWYVGQAKQHTTYCLNNTDIDVYFLGQQSFGSLCDIVELLEAIQPDIIVTFGDMHMVEGLTQLDLCWKKKWIHWWTVDNNCPTEKEFAIARHVGQLVALTQFGASVIKREMHLVVPVIGHTYQVSCGIGNKAIAKQNLGISENTIVYGCIARNFWRKNLHTLINAFAHAFPPTKPAVLLLHIDTLTSANEGCNILEMVNKLHLNGRVLVSEASLTPLQLTSVIDAMDFHVLPSYGEGFGVPVIETMARGVPNIVPNHTTLPELVGNSGYIVPLSISGNVHPRTGREYFGPDPSALSDLLQNTCANAMANKDAYYESTLSAINEAARYNKDNMTAPWSTLLSNFQPSNLQFKKFEPSCFNKNKKKILLCSAFYVPNLIGGGEYTIHEMMRGLIQRNWDVRVLTLFEGITGNFGKSLLDDEIVIDGVSVIQSGDNWYTHLINILDNDPPDLVITYEINAWYSLRFLREAKRRNIKTVMYEQYWRLLTQNFANLAEQTPNPPVQGLECNTLTDLMLVNSDFTAAMFKKFLGRQTEIIYPVVTSPKQLNDNQGAYILMVNPSVAKGVDVVFYLARCFPDLSFKLVGALGEDNTYLELKKYPNISYCSHTNNMSELYQQAYAVLFPSCLEETFGRVPVEAMLHKVLVVARDIGAVSSVTEKHALLVARNAPMSDWSDTITWLLAHPAEKKEIEHQAYEFIKQKFDSKKILDKLAQQLTMLTERPSVSYVKTFARPPILAICDRGFDGIKTALEYAQANFPNSIATCLIQPKVDKDYKIDIKQAIIQHNTQAIIYAGWSNDYVAILKWLKNDYPHLKHIINWHSPLGQIELAGASEINNFVKCNQLLVTNTIDYIAVPFEKDATLFRQSYHSNYRWLPDTLAPISINKILPDHDELRLGFFALPSARKNLLAQLSAIRLLHLALLQKPGKWRSLKLYLGNGFYKHNEYMQFLDMLDIPYSLLPFFEDKQEYYNWLGSMHINFQVTFSEAFNYVCAESLMLNVPCIGSMMTPALVSQEQETQALLNQHLIVREIDNVTEIYEKLYNLATMFDDNYQQVCQMGHKHALHIMQQHNKAIESFLNEI